MNERPSCRYKFQCLQLYLEHESGEAGGRRRRRVEGQLPALFSPARGRGGQAGDLGPVLGGLPRLRQELGNLEDETWRSCEERSSFDLTLTSHTFFLARSRLTSLAEEDNLLCLAREPMMLAEMQVGRLMQLEVAKYICIACQRCVY